MHVFGMCKWMFLQICFVFARERKLMKRKRCVVIKLWKWLGLVEDHTSRHTSRKDIISCRDSLPLTWLSVHLLVFLFLFLIISLQNKLVFYQKKICAFLDCGSIVFKRLADKSTDRPEESVSNEVVKCTCCNEHGRTFVPSTGRVISCLELSNELSAQSMQVS